MGLYPTCQAITGYDDKGDNVRCLKPTLDGARYCPEHDPASSTQEPWDSEEFPDDDYSTVVDELDD